VVLVDGPVVAVVVDSRCGWGRLSFWVGGHETRASAAAFAPMSSSMCEPGVLGQLGVGEEGSEDDVGKAALEGS
jgi:hypothetical protein